LRQSIQLLSKLLPIKSVAETIHLKQHEDPFVDGLRGLSVLMVILFHTIFAVHFAFRKQPELFQQFLGQIPLGFDFVLGFDKAVDIFFMISAYLLGSSLRKQASNGSLSARRFYLQRMGRIYPLFLVALLVYGDPTSDKFYSLIWQNLFFVASYVDPYLHIIPVGWSLSVEMQCYLVLPLVMIVLNRVSKPIAVIMLLIVGSIILRWWITATHPNTVNTPFIHFINGESSALEFTLRIYESTPGRLGSFIIGLLWAYMEPIAKGIKLNPVVANLYLIILLGLLYISMNFPMYSALSSYYVNFNPTVNQVLVVGHRYLFSFALLGIILIVRALPNIGLAGAIRTSLAIRFFRPFSRLAFPAYLFHFPFIVLAWVMVLGTTDIKVIEVPTLWQAGLVWVLSSIMVLWFSLPLHYKIERPGIGLGKRLAEKWGRQ